jgi:hypothetical protein
MPCPSHPPWLDHSNYACRRVRHSGSETGCFRPHVRGWETRTLLGPLEGADLQFEMRTLYRN